MITREQLQKATMDDLLGELSSVTDQLMVRSLRAEILRRFARAFETIESLQRQLRIKEGMMAELRKCAEAAKRQLQQKPKGGPVDGQAGEAD